jgi:hypothetical protein
MNITAFFWPAFALVLLTFCVMIRMLMSRVAQMKTLKVHPQAVSTSAQQSAMLPDTRASDNFRNLFELPVLFYAALCFATLMQSSSQVLIILAWVYVGLRIVHSLIQCGYNKVMHRFYAFFTSVWVLLAMWFALAYSLIT